MKRIFILFLLVSTLTACASTITNRGYNSEKLQKVDTLIKPGVANSSTVRNLFGSPSATSSFGGETWYYMSSKTKSLAFLKPKVMEQNVVAIAFNEDGTVNSIRKYDRNDMRDVASRDDYTRSEGNDLTVLQQLLGNVGRFNPAGGGLPGAPSTIGTGTGP